MGRPMLDITSDIQSLTTFRRRSGDFMKQLKKSKRPVVLTVKGKAAAIVQDAEAYQRLARHCRPWQMRKKASARVWTMLHMDVPARRAKYSTRFVANMTYRVELADRAVRDLELHYLEKNAVESRAAARWYNRLEDAVSALGTYPYRCPVAPEGRKMKRKLRHLLYGKKPHVYRVIYEIDERQRTVWVLTIRHAARRMVKASDLA